MRDSNAAWKEIIGDNLKAERAPFSSDKDYIMEVPFVFRPNLIAAIADTVDQHERYAIKNEFIVSIKTLFNLPYIR